MDGYLGGAPLFSAASAPAPHMALAGSAAAAPALPAAGAVPAVDFFGLVVPGRPLVASFVQVGPNRFVVELPNPSEVAEVTFFVKPGAPLPDCGVVLYYSHPPFDAWHLLGAVTGRSPSGIFQTGWPADRGERGAPVVRIGLSLESVDFAENLRSAVSGAEDRKVFALKIAENLFRFMESFHQKSVAGDVLVVPVTALDTWMKRFQEKYERDPNFMLRQ